MHHVIVYFLIALTSVQWALGNRFWGSGDEEDDIGKTGAAAWIGFSTTLFLFYLGAPAELCAGGMATTTVGFWLGRVTDGIRGSWLQKSLRGWKYGLIYVGMAVVLWSWWPLVPLLFFWQGGVAHWASWRFITVPAIDHTKCAELADGLVRGAIFLSCVAVVLSGGGS